MILSLAMFVRPSLVIQTIPNIQAKRQGYPAGKYVKKRNASELQVAKSVFLTRSRTLVHGTDTSFIIKTCPTMLV